MLLPDNIHPENSIYYNGSIVLEVLQTNPILNLIDLYQFVIMKRKMSFSVFILSLDWLYLLDVAKIDIKGKVILCT